MTRSLTKYDMLDAKYDEYSTDHGKTWLPIPKEWDGYAYWQLRRRWFGRPPEHASLRTLETGKYDRDEIGIWF